MPRRRILSALFALAVPVLAVACDSQPDPFTQETFPLCAQQTMRLVGTIDDMSIDVTLPAQGGGLAQDGTGGEFQFQGNRTSDPSEADLRLTWDHDVDIGAVTSAKGTLRLVDGPFANQALCAGAGTVIKMPKDDSLGTIQFVLDGIHSGDGCGVAHTGQLRGCSR